MNLKNAVEMSTCAAPAPTVTLESELNALNEMVSGLETAAAQLISDLEPVSHRGPPPQPDCTAELVLPVLPFALEQTRLTRDRVAGVMARLAEARVALAL